MAGIFVQNQKLDYLGFSLYFQIIVMQKLNSLSDDQLLIRFQKDDMHSFEEIYNRYWSRLYVEAYKRLKNTEDAEELVQNLFTSLWANRKKARIHSSLGAYLFTSIRYLVINHVQKETVRKNYKNGLFDQLEGKLFDNSTEYTVFLNDLNTRIEEGCTQMPPKCRRVFELSRKWYKTNKEIAQELMISEKTVENHLTKALRILKVIIGTVIIFIMIY